MPKTIRLGQRIQSRSVNLLGGEHFLLDRPDDSRLEQAARALAERYLQPYADRSDVDK